MRAMTTKREFQERVAELEETLEEFYDRIGELLSVEDVALAKMKKRAEKAERERDEALEKVRQWEHDGDVRVNERILELIGERDHLERIISGTEARKQERT